MGERFDQSVRISTHEPSGIGPCSASHASTTSGVSSKSSSLAAPSEQSITTTGPTKFSGALFYSACVSWVLAIVIMFLRKGDIQDLLPKNRA